MTGKLLALFLFCIISSSPLTYGLPIDIIDEQLGINLDLVEEKPELDTKTQLAVTAEREEAFVTTAAVAETKKVETVNKEEAKPTEEATLGTTEVQRTTEIQLTTVSATAESSTTLTEKDAETVTAEEATTIETSKVNEVELTTAAVLMETTIEPTELSTSTSDSEVSENTTATDESAKQQVINVIPPEYNELRHELGKEYQNLLNRHTEMFQQHNLDIFNSFLKFFENFLRKYRQKTYRLVPAN